MFPGKRFPAIRRLAGGIALGLGLAGSLLTPAGYAQDAKIKGMSMRIAHGAPTSDPRHLGALEIKKILEAESKGKIKVDVFPAGQLGEDRDLIEAAQGGGLQIAILPTAFMGGFQPLMTLLDVPYLFPQDPTLRVDGLDGHLKGVDHIEGVYRCRSAVGVYKPHLDCVRSI